VYIGKALFCSVVLTRSPTTGTLLYSIRHPRGNPAECNELCTVYDSSPIVESRRWLRSAATAALIAFYNRRSRFLCRCRSSVEQPSALGDVISVLFGFSKSIVIQFHLFAPSRNNNTFLRFILSPCFILQLYVFFYYVFFSSLVVLCTVVLQSYDFTTR